MCYIGEVLLWLYGDAEGTSEVGDTTQSRKRPRVDSPAPTTSKREAIAKTISTVETIVGELRERHGDTAFSVEQFNCWAHMINCGKWSSHDEPPDFPFFNKAKKVKGKRHEKQDDRSDDATTNVTSQVTVSTSSPSSKRLSRRAQCIDQLSKWHLLLEAGGITRTQYDELKESILDDMK